MVVASMGHNTLVGPTNEEREVAFDLLRVILANERVRGCSPMLELGDEEGVDGAFSIRELGGGLLEEEGEASDSWMTSCLANFCHCLGMPTKLFEGEILKLLKRMKGRKERKGKVIDKRRKL